MARKISVEIVGDSASLERSFRRSTASANRFSADLGRAGRGVVAVTAGYRSLARSVAFASAAFVGTAGLTAAVKSSLTGFSQFQESLQQSAGLAGVAQTQVAGFSKQILALAPAVGKSPQELAKAFYFIASSGIAASKAMEVLRVSAKASAAGLGETQVVADAVTSAINAYGAANLSAQKATDVLVATVREGKGEADQFAGVIGNVAALASQLGVSFNEVGAALAAQTRLGTDAETAATQLQRVFSSLVKVSPQAAKAFKSVGLNADELRSQLGTKGLLFVLEEVKKAFGNNLPAIAKAFGDVRALRGVLALVGNQSAEVDKIFQRMTKTSGSLKTAFDAVSKDTAQKFRELHAAVQVAGISIGAILAPLAGKIADALAGAADEFTKFINKVSAQGTITGKLSVVWTGIEDAARGAESALVSAIGRVDWAKVWSGARGIADGLQARIESIDWGNVGKSIGDGISDAVKVAIPAAKDIAKRFGDIVAAIDFISIGRKMGPGLAAAIVTAFVTITDPSFWVHNWDLALAVGLTAFGGSVGRIAGKLGPILVRPFARMGGDIALAIAGGIARIAPRLGEPILAALLRLPGIIDRVLGLIVGPFVIAFRRLGRISQFVVRVLGIQAAIDAVAGLVKVLGGLISNGLDGAWDAMKRGAIKAVLGIIEPFTHLPGFLGGGPFRAMKDALQGQLDAMETASAKTAKVVGDVFAAAGLTAAQAFNQAQSEHVAQQKRSGGSGIPVFTRTPGTAPPPATLTSSGTTAATEAVKKGFELPFRIRLAQAEAAATASLGDDLRVAKAIRAFILKVIPKLHGEKLIGAYQELGQVNSQIADAVKKAADKVRSFAVPEALQLAAAKASATASPLDDLNVQRRIKAAAQKALRSGRLAIQGQIDAWNAIAAANQALLANVDGFNLTAQEKKIRFNDRNKSVGIGPHASPLRSVGTRGLTYSPTIVSPDLRGAEKLNQREFFRFKQRFA